MLKNYEPNKKWEDYTRLICGKGFLGTSKKTSGVFVSFSEKLKEIIPSKYWITRSNQAFLIGFTTRQQNGSWEIQLDDDLKFNLTEKQVTLVS
jgi:hypothetical protein